MKKPYTVQLNVVQLNKEHLNIANLTIVELNVEQLNSTDKLNSTEPCKERERKPAIGCISAHF